MEDSVVPFLKMKILRMRYTSTFQELQRKIIFEPRTLSTSWRHRKCRKSLMRSAPRKRKFHYVQHNGGYTRWDGVIRGNGMACTLMATSVKILLNIVRNSLKDGKSMRNGCIHMTTMATAITNSPDSRIHLVNVSGLFWSRTMSRLSMRPIGGKPCGPISQTKQFH